MEFFATCPAGFESLLSLELQALHLSHVRPLKGQVAFEGPLADGYRACLCSRLASRVVAVLMRGRAGNADELYETMAAIAWEQQLLPTTSYAIDAHGTNQQLRTTQFIALRAKDALADRMRSRTGALPPVDPKSPGLRISVRLSRDRVTIGIDLAGEPLFRRGYESTRTPRGMGAPLRPDYAAALLAAGNWTQLCTHENPRLIASFCGTGTLAVEAAMIARDQAPGLLRTRWSCQHWAQHDAETWNALAQELRARADAGAARPVMLQLCDPRPGCEQATRQMLRAAGIDLAPLIAPASEPLESSGPTLLACDLSWTEGQALAVHADALQDVAVAVAALPANAHVAVIAGDDLATFVLGRPDHATPIVLGRDEAKLLSYDSVTADARPAATLPAQERVSLLLDTSSQFAARLAKVYKQRRKWARREDVSCYRIYDADLPDYAVSIDLFEGSETPGRWLQIYEYAPPKSVDPTLAQARLLDVVTLAPRILGVRPQDVFVRVRTKAKGGSQYADEAQDISRTRLAKDRRPAREPLPPGAHLIDEGGLTFEVNFSTRLDCGIFLDHRDTRAMLREMAKQTKGSKRFLNLFAYTGTGTCYAADGGAKHTTTVDLSRPSLDWARRNMRRNGFEGKEHEYVQADVLRWVGEQRHTHNRWDLIFCDVPTFSNSSRMRSASFDVQRDHAELLIGVSRLLTREGACVFSCNLRSFKIDHAALAKAGVVAEDITAQTIPEDFARNPKIHHCYLVRRTTQPAEPR